MKKIVIFVLLLFCLSCDYQTEYIDSTNIRDFAGGVITYKDRHNDEYFMTIRLNNESVNYYISEEIFNTYNSNDTIK